MARGRVKLILLISLSMWELSKVRYFSVANKTVIPHKIERFNFCLDRE